MRFTRTRSAGTVLILLAAGAVSFAAPSTAAGHHPTTAGMHPKIAVHHAGIHPNTVPSTYYGAGYFLYPGEANGLASVSATFTAPAVTCQRADDNEWLLPGIWVYSSGALTEQVDVNLNCNSGTQLRTDVICISGSGCDESLTIAPRDKIVVSLAYTPTATVGTVKDITAGTSAQIVGAAITTDDTVFVGDEGPSLFGPTKVPTFTKVSFKTVRINGEYLVDGPFPTQYNLKTAGNIQITTSAIKSDGASFDTTFNHN